MSRPTTRKLGLAAVLALAFSGATIGVAGATNTVEIDSQIVLRESFPAFHGKVKSSNAACAQDRRVKVFKKKRSGGRKLLGKTQSRPQRQVGGHRRPAQVRRLPGGGQAALRGHRGNDLRLPARRSQIAVVD